VIPRFLIATALAAAILLPITIAVLCGVSSLLGALGDATGSLALARGALLGGILWGVDLVSLVLMLAVNAMPEAPPSGKAMPEPLDEGERNEED